ncbi:four-carbon acid sugar kinase family protein [Peribacillus cavernae]|uniref:Four-carbon acid sugar kinase family protein n=1 Tax=Peribacillus cavernae TaxID=1674310 RepID=A0A3S0VHN4_9BACI|nr:four-carbon acid sugar kinase family protein [Peribacillus cavernae]MDQ0217696.1 uncharacterized protein YgbK (DUF1537 family) [Peribacillus cavernae]RUQ28166.1 four-carbon acid sugar kinase family protein [Peribacillus cavernae]
MKIAVIADDLTGANGTGVLLTKSGFSTATILQGLSGIKSFNYDAVCIDTDSRYLRKDLAYRRVGEAASLMLNQGVQLFCKRIDSTIRGNIGSEIDAVLDTIGGDSVAVVMPSFPASGRTTVGGYLLVNGLPVQETEVAKDPQCPLNESFVPWIISKQTDKKIDHVGMDDVLKGEDKIAQRLNEFVENGNRIIVIDAATDDQIEHVAIAMEKLHHVFVPVDPGPLTLAYAKRKYASLIDNSKILVIIGSCTSLTQKQINHLIEKMSVKPIYIDPLLLASADMEARNNEINKRVSEGLDRLKRESVIVLTTNHPEQPLLDLKSLAGKQNTSEASLAKRITDGLAIISQKVIRGSEVAINGCFSSGGDVTASLCATGKTHGIQLIDEVIPLAAYGQFIGGYLDGMSIVTKGGLVGDEGGITTCVRFLINQLSKSLNKKENVS